MMAYTSAFGSRRRRYLYFARYVSIALRLLSRDMRRVRRLGGPDLVMNNYLLRDIGLKQEDLKRTARRPNLPMEYHDDYGQY